MHTGDLGYFDEDGYLYLVDRKKDMINRGGYNVYSIEVESALYEHPDVVEAAVVGVPHDVLGQDVCAVVRVHAGATPSSSTRYGRSSPTDSPTTSCLDASWCATHRCRSGMHKVDKKALLAEVVPARPAT